MNSLQRLFHWPAMWWRRKGFGVHSPFAFSLITRTISERGEYYAYSELRHLTGKDFRKFSLFFRLICHFKPASIKILSSDKRLETVVRLADSRIVLNKIDSEMIVIDSLTSESEVNSIFNTIYSTEKQPSFILLFNINRQLNGKLWSLLNPINAPIGMTFTDGRSAIVCLTANLPRQSFKLLF